MKFNEEDMIEIAKLRKPDLEGRLQHKSPSSGAFRDKGFRERFFKLIGNLLFYYRLNEFGQIESQPVGLLVLENVSVQPESRSLNLPFAFEMTFADEPDKRHIFTTRTEKDMHCWIKALQRSSYQYWKRCHDLATKLATTSFYNTRLEASGHVSPVPKPRSAEPGKIPPRPIQDDLIKF